MIKFGHVADVHLGYRQYNLNQRRIDFADAWNKAVDHFIAQKVDFIIIAGDFFHTKDPQWVDIGVAQKSFLRLNTRGIGIHAIIGNHDASKLYDEDVWTSIFPEVHRIEGLHIFSNMTITGFDWAAGDTENVLNNIDIKSGEYKDKFNILVFHAGIEGVLNQTPWSVSKRTMNRLKSIFHYAAIGHIHLPFVIDNWIFNPGSLEACSITEQNYVHRGINIVTVKDNKKYKVDHIKIDGRPFFDLDKDSSYKKLKKDAIIRYRLSKGEDEAEAMKVLEKIEPLHVRMEKPERVQNNNTQSKAKPSVSSIYRQVFGENITQARLAEQAILKDKPSDIEGAIFT